MNIREEGVNDFMLIEDDQDSDDFSVTTEKKCRPSTTPKKCMNNSMTVMTVKSTPDDMDDDIVPVSQFTTPLSLSTSDSQMSSEVVKQQEDVTIQPISDKNYKVDMERPIIISPNKISSR